MNLLTREELEKAIYDKAFDRYDSPTMHSVSIRVDELMSLFDTQIHELIYGMHVDIMNGNLKLGHDPGAAFDYGRVHQWIDAYIEKIEGQAPTNPTNGSQVKGQK